VHHIASSIAGTALAQPFPLFAQTMPETARLLVGLPPGGQPDLIARTLAEYLGGRLAGSVVVETHTGAGGRIAVDVLLRSGADSDVMLVTPSGVLTLVPHTFRNVSYRPFEDLVPLTTLAYFGFALAIGPLVPEQVRTLTDLADWCRTNPRKASFATVAAGSPPHFVGELLKRQLNFDWTHVPYRNDPIPELLGGQIAANINSPGNLLPFVQDERLRIVGITGPARWSYLPDVATFSEQGVDGLRWQDWYGLYMSARAPADLVRRNGEIVRAALSEPALAKRWHSALTIDPTPSTAEELMSLAKEDDARWAVVVKSIGFAAE
jgi:tripartite-type tricarboxylate transporter receptor subunit TctC